MSTRPFTEPYHCSSDCTSRGCPGHEIRVEFHYTSDTVMIQNFQETIVLDRCAWDALRRIAREEDPDNRQYDLSLTRK